jgi:DNA invertase Pin-like site-specific DNA recombinase
MGFEFICEKVEGGISGFKISASKRDAIIEIKAMAERHEFDVLGIYMSDRLGRIAEETPLIVSFLNARGIKVISYTEGEIMAHTHTDKLLTYIRDWQAEGESLKTSARCCDALIDVVKQGRWKGGTLPYGYRKVVKGTLNFKGRPIFDVEIDPERAEVVRDIFRLYGKEHCGTRQIAKYLNDKEIYTTEGQLWSSPLICKMLRCRTYTGVFVLHSKVNKPKIESPFMPNFEIIPQSEWDEVQTLLTANKKYPDARRPTRCGTLLLTGYTYCGQCGCKLAGSMAATLASEKHKPKEARKPYPMYRCRSYEKPKGERAGCKPSMYSAARLEEAVVRDAKEFLLSVDKDKLRESYEVKKQTELMDVSKRASVVATVVGKKENELKKLKDEVIKTLVGESTYSPQLLNSLVTEKEAELADLKSRQAEIRAELESVEAEIAVERSFVDNIENWAIRFDKLAVPEQRTMLLNIIDRIDVFPDRMEIAYKVRLHATEQRRAFEGIDGDHTIGARHSLIHDETTINTEYPNGDLPTKPSPDEQPANRCISPRRKAAR